MENKNLEKALEIVGKLMNGEDISASLYQEYISNGEVYSHVEDICKKFGLSIYEYEGGLYLTAGYGNHIFGFSNEELKQQIGVKQNRELYLCYLIMYGVAMNFYKDSASYTFVEFVKDEDVIRTVDTFLQKIISGLQILSLEEVEEQSFRTLALMWEDLPMVVNEETTSRAARGSKKGFVKLTFNFMVSQGMLLANEGRYYPTKRFHGILRGYFEDNKSRIMQILKGVEKNATH